MAKSISCFLLIIVWGAILANGVTHEYGADLQRIRKLGAEYCLSFEKTKQMDPHLRVEHWPSSVFFGVSLQIATDSVITNLHYTFNSSNLACPLSVVSSDINTNGFYVSYFKSGVVRQYHEFKRGILDGIMVQFYKNAIPNTLLTVSNNYCVGKGYAFHVDGSVKRVNPFTQPKELVVARPPDRNR